MKLLKFIKLTLYCLMMFVLLYGCSSSTRSERYSHSKSKSENRSGTNNNPEKKEEKTRFDNTTTYNDVPDTSNDEFDEVPVEENPIDKTKFVEHYEKMRSLNVPFTEREKILFEVIKYLETPYKYGGNTDKGIDCSAFTKQVYEKSVSVELPRTAREQFNTGEKVSKDELKFGDLVFFNTRKTNNPGHVGIYLGDNQFVHASKTYGVTVSSLDANYYKKRYAGARRMMDNISR